MGVERERGTKASGAQISDPDFLNMIGAKFSTEGIRDMHVDLNPPISESRPLSIRNLNPAPPRFLQRSP